MAAKPPDPACTRGSRTTATRVVLGDISLSRSSNFALKLNSKLVKPVALPPGRAKLATKPLPTGSIVVTNTIGTVRLICSKSATIELAVPRTTSGFDATNSAAYLRNSSVLPAPQRVSTCTLPPSCQPNCCSACTNAASQAWPCSASVFISTPIRRIRSGRCARAASGIAVEITIPVMKSRRRIAAPRLRAVRTCFGMSQLQQGITTGGIGTDAHFARQQSSGLNVRFGSKADIRVRWRNVRFASKSGHSALQPIASLFDHLVGCHLHRHRYGKSERLRGLEVYDEFEFRRLLHRQIGRPLPFKDTIYVRCGASKLVELINSVRHKPTITNEFSISVQRGQPMRRRQFNNKLPNTRVFKERIARQDQATVWPTC